MLIRTGFSLAFDTFGPTPMNLLLNVHPDRAGDLVTPEIVTFVELLTEMIAAMS